MAAATVEKLLRGKLHHDLMSLNFLPAPKKSVIFFQTPLLFLLRVVEAEEYRMKRRALFGYFRDAAVIEISYDALSDIASQK